MNKRRLTLLIGSLAFGMVANGQITNPAPYCPAGYDDAAGSFNLPHSIQQVTFGTLNNNSGTTQYPGQHYVYYNNLAAPNLIKGSSYPLTVKFDNGTLHFLAVYIDYNKDNDFSDPGELVWNIHDPLNTSPNPATTNITIPTTAQAGITRMRVLCFEDDMYTNIGNPPPSTAPPCTAYNSGLLDWGETEDYDINITPTTSIESATGNAQLEVYPNPAKDMLNIDLPVDDRATIAVQLMDYSGRIVKSIIEDRSGKQQHKITLQVSDLSSGIYNVIVTKDGANYSRRVSVIR